jgi:DNA-binding response OmpR family regulator
MLRRTQLELNNPETEVPFVFGHLEINPAQRRITRRGKEISLKPKEFDLLVFLLRHPGQVFSREQLLDQVWGFGHIGDIRTVDVHIRWLREKIERDPSKPKLLETVRGVGYRVRAPQKGLVV